MHLTFELSDKFNTENKMIKKCIYSRFCELNCDKKIKKKAFSNFEWHTTLEWIFIRIYIKFIFGLTCSFQQDLEAQIYAAVQTPLHAG